MSTKQVIVLLDETGSMQPLQTETIQSFNSYVADLRAQPEAGDVRFWLTLFNSGKTEVRHEGIPLADVADLTPETYQPNNLTPLYDAIMATMASVDGEAMRLAGRYAYEALMVIVTDGQENASHKYPGEAGREAVKSTIVAREALGWKFLFLASSLDVALEAAHVGIPMAASSSTASPAHAMRTASLSTQDWMAGRPQAAASSYAARAKTPKDADDGNQSWTKGS